MIWRSDYQKTVKKLQQLGVTDILKNNSEVCVLCSVRYHDVYGLSLNIFDVDPSFGEAQIDRNRRMILEKLTAEGILKKNAGTDINADALRIGLITSRDSAAYNDFVRTLMHSPYSFRIILAYATMQGENTAGEVVNALSALVQAKVDVICIVRGGGSQTDLAWFDSEKMARAVTDCLIPVWVGIGHEIDTVVLDYVAHTAFKTPTAVVEALLGRIQQLDSRLSTNYESLKSIVDRIVAKHEQDMDRLLAQVSGSLKKYLDLLKSKNETYIHRAESKFVGIFNEKESILANSMHKIQYKSLETIQRYSQTAAVKQNRLQSSCFNIEKDCTKSLSDTATRLIPSLQKYLDTKRNDLSRNITGTQNGLRKHLNLAISNLINRLLKSKGEFMQIFAEKNNKLSRLFFAIEGCCKTRIAGRERGSDARLIFLKSTIQQFLKRKEDSMTGKVNRLRLDRFINIVNACQRTLTEKGQLLNVLTPENMLRRGYAITRDKNGALIRSIRQIDIGLNVVTQYVDGITESTITGKEEKR